MDEFVEFSREDLIALVLQQRQTLLLLQERVAVLEAKLETKSGPGAPPPFVRANVKRKQEKQERKKRSQAFTRQREQPTEVCCHAASHCPDCGRTLSGGTEHRRRQVIDIPQTPVQVTDHVIMARWCGVCRKRVLPTLNLSEQVVGQHRVGVRLMSLIGWLHTVGRLPLRRVQSLLEAVYGLHLSVGELSEVLHTLAARGKEHYQRLQQEVRGSPFVHADETGWREDGHNGYLWSFSTPSVRFFHYNQSRSGAVPVEVLGEQFGGICISDFYGGYNRVGVVRQRCWVHFLRDLYALTQAHPQDGSVQSWARGVRGVYDEARAWQAAARAAQSRHGQEAGHFGYGVFARQEKRRTLEQQLYALALPFLGQAAQKDVAQKDVAQKDVAQKDVAQKDVPQRVLCQRIASFLPELFVFVEHLDIPSENNAAERSVRPAVISRKVSGGTRSSKGSATKATLLSLFGTWQVQDQDALAACRRMLVEPSLLSTLSSVPVA